MGIKDLLKALAPDSIQKLITEFKGKRIAIDASGWLHKGLFAAAEDIVDTGVDSELYVDFMLARARNFILNGDFRFRSFIACIVFSVVLIHSLPPQELHPFLYLMEKGTV
jgi:XPG N-terminal domain